MHVSQDIQEGSLLMMSPRRGDDTEMSLWLKLVPAISILITIGVTFGVAQTQISRAQADINQLQEAYRADHDSVVEMRQNLRYIRERLDEALANNKKEKANGLPTEH